MAIDRDWKNFKCEDCGCDIKDTKYKYIFLGYHINDSKHKKVCFNCFLKNPEYGNLYHQVVIVEFDSNPPHQVIREENIKQYSGGNQKVPEEKPKPVNNNNGISKGEWILIIGEILIISLILIGLFYYCKEKKTKINAGTTRK
ncbi:hypothetical protein [endosymbiont GvMRE of Glomus versiforme]|uniref:hypothetical protein n=1 Tax=endosymbiont GvMRE of Glomus versiforme TaxID=2039283 RepID=UPI000EED4C38|nr:hypothetical protein [endosymbiont GvMRE of Glomus versiforme]RHZ36481.1 hypothetical protein GvMRE_I2g514 [endosymbiont GvMRE of Glomus versiforme]